MPEDGTLCQTGSKVSYLSSQEGLPVTNLGGVHICIVEVLLLYVLQVWKETEIRALHVSQVGVQPNIDGCALRARTFGAEGALSRD